MSTSSQRPGTSTRSPLRTANYQYPDTLGQKVAAGQHYMILTSYESINSMNKRPNAKSSIALYIPAGGLTTTISQTYEEIEGGALFAQSGAAAVAEFDKAMADENSGGGVAKAALTTAGGMGIARAVSGLKKNVLQRVGGGFIQAGLGLAVNNHLSVGYKGPTGFRDHSFAFKFFPKNKTESRNVKNIIEDFKNGSTPRMVGKTSLGGVSASAFFKAPRHYIIKFMSGGTKNEFLHEIKPSVITSMQTNYDPISFVSFHEDGAPVQIDLNLTFKELELVTSDDEVKEGVADDVAGEATSVLGERNAIPTPRSSKPGSSLEPTF